MSEIKFVQKSPKGTATVDTSQLLIGTDGRAFLRNSMTGMPVILAEEQLAAIQRHFGTETWLVAIENVGELK